MDKFLPKIFSRIVTIFVLSILIISFVRSAYAYVNSQAMAALFGQLSFTASSPNGGGSISASVLNTADEDGAYGRVRIVNEGLILTDTLNNRVIILNPSDGDINADIVLGQNDFTHGEENRGITVNKGGLNKPMDAMYDGTNFIVADTNNNRVLIWNSFPDTNLDPDIVLGQADFLSNQPNRGGSPDANTLFKPAAVYSDGFTLVVADTENNRMLVWTEFPTTDGEPADMVFGQLDFTHNECNQGADQPSVLTLCRPKGVQLLFGAYVFIADTDNNRVLLWSGIGESALLVFGQEDEFSRLPNKGGSIPDNTTLHSPTEAMFDVMSGQFFVVDTNNNRILIWESFVPDSNPISVLGQNDFSGYLPNKGCTATAYTLNRPTSMFPFGDMAMYVLDAGNHRMPVYVNSDNPEDGMDPSPPVCEDEESEPDEETDEDINDVFIDEDDDDGDKKEVKKCEFKKPPAITRFNLTPVIQNGVKGIKVNWVQYDATKMIIKIDDGTGSFPWMTDRLINDGNEFLPNVDISQKIMIKPINHCKEGSFSTAISFKL